MGTGAVSTPSAKPFFVYGTLRPGRGNHRRCLGDIRHVTRPACLSGARLFDLGRPYPYASTTGAGTADVVKGDLIEVAQEDYELALARLDGLEGHPVHYTRQEVEVESNKGKERAWAYLAGPAIEALLPKAAIVPGGEWRAVA